MRFTFVKLLILSLLFCSTASSQDRSDIGSLVGNFENLLRAQNGEEAPTLEPMVVKSMPKVRLLKETPSRLKKVQQAKVFRIV